jgi:hypothetical protein
MPPHSYRISSVRITAREDISSPRFWPVLAFDSSIECQRGLLEWFGTGHRLVQSYDFDAINLRA